MSFLVSFGIKLDQVLDQDLGLLCHCIPAALCERGQGGTKTLEGAGCSCLRGSSKGPVSIRWWCSYESGCRCV